MREDANIDALLRFLKHKDQYAACIQYHRAAKQQLHADQYRADHRVAAVPDLHHRTSPDYFHLPVNPSHTKI